MTHSTLVLQLLTSPFRVDDDIDEDVDDEDDFGDDDDDSEDDDEEGDDEEIETWQVSSRSLKGGPSLTSGIELPRLTGIYQLS
jgi:hypothetical protein